ncbi:protein Mis18-beta [Brachionichthys hirsutus]|uniref:protein Mis18-beta n=1 Tax=Brachionichthys hirsutus TaxID=412623 RepID=UPI003604C8C8
MEFDGSILIQITDKLKMSARTTEDNPQMTFHCQKCHIVLGDSFDVCGEMKCMDSIMCLRVTEDVVVSDANNEGELADCIFSLLICRGCQSRVGKVVHSSPACFDAVRSLFLLSKASISCYILNSSSMVEASTLTFKMNALKESVTEVKNRFEEQLDRMSRLQIRLANTSAFDS